MSAHGIVLFAHGARDPGWAAPFRTIKERLSCAMPGTPVELAFLELMQPDLATVIDELAEQGIERVTLVPLFMAQGGHLKQDLPQLIAQLAERHPRLDLRVTPPIGEVDAILDAIVAWARQAVTRE